VDLAQPFYNCLQIVVSILGQLQLNVQAGDHVGHVPISKSEPQKTGVLITFIRCLQRHLGPVRTWVNISFHLPGIDLAKLSEGGNILPTLWAQVFQKTSLRPLGKLI
jgi:hypothetical protein